MNTSQTFTISNFVDFVLLKENKRFVATGCPLIPRLTGQQFNDLSSYRTNIHT